MDNRTKTEKLHSIARFFISANQSIYLFFFCIHTHTCINHQQNFKKLNSVSGHNEKMCIKNGNLLLPGVKKLIFSFQHIRKRL